MLGPWNTPPNFLAAMSGGASAGLQARGQDITARGQDIAAGEAADRLALAYQQLAAEEQSRAQAAKEKMDIASTANALRAQQIDMLNRWHQGQIEAQQAQLGQAQAKASALEKYRTGKLGIEQAKLDKPALHFGTQGEVLQEDPDTGEIIQVRPPRIPVRPTPFDLQAHSALLNEEKSLQNSLTTGGAFMNDDTRLKALNRIGQIRRQRAALESKYATPSPAEGAPSAITPSPAGGTVPAAAPKRIKVKGPGGVSGTVPEGSSLPEGWSAIEEAAKEAAADEGLDEEEE